MQRRARIGVVLGFIRASLFHVGVGFEQGTQDSAAVATSARHLVRYIGTSMIARNTFSRDVRDGSVKGGQHDILQSGGHCHPTLLCSGRRSDPSRRTFAMPDPTRRARRPDRDRQYGEIVFVMRASPRPGMPISPSPSGRPCARSSINAEVGGARAASGELTERKP